MCFRGGNFFVRAIDRSSVHLRVVIGIGSTGFRDLWISDFRISGVWILVFQDFRIFGFFQDSGSFVFLRVWDFKVFWMFGFSGSFRDLDRFRLLIQRCKRVGEIGNFFDQGCVLPDESTRAPGEGLWPDEGFWGVGICFWEN